MEVLQAIILGIIQGITEWLPISSSGHLVLAEHLLNLSQPIIFDIFLHLGSLIVILIVFRKKIIDLIKGFFRWEKEKVDFVLYLVIASIPIALVGFFLNDFIKSIFNEPSTVGYGLLFTSVLLFLSQFQITNKNKKTTNNESNKVNKDNPLNFINTAFMGIAQAFAILPGVSRSGSTISTGLMQSAKKEDVAFFSFMMFIPAILGASILEIGNITSITDSGALLVGTLTTIIVGYLSLRLLLNIISRGKFHYFSYYCLVLGLVVLVFL